MKKSSYLIEYAAAQIGRPYWAGTYGKTATKAYYEAEKKQYPNLYWQPASTYLCQLGQKVHDCCGLIKGAMWCSTVNAEPVYVSSQDHSVKGFYNASADKGRIFDTTPLIDGMLVFNSTFGHVGIYAGGYVINAKGHAYGVVKEPYVKGRWYYWALCNYFDYGEQGTLKPGDIIRISDDATVFGKKTKFASWVYKMNLTVIEIQGNRVVFSAYPEKGVTGSTHIKYVTKVK